MSLVIIDKLTEAKKMKKRGFTLVELLVVIAIIALLMGILMPALARVRQIAHRMVCGTNLSGIGKAMLIYANDYDEQYPIAGGPRARWSTKGTIFDWDCLEARGNSTLTESAYGRFPQNQVTITSSLYLLVKYADVTTKQFVCKGDVGTKEFTMSDAGGGQIEELIEAWDFGGSKPGQYCSYSYHLPHGDGLLPGFPVHAVSLPSSPICADRTPYLDKNAADYVNESEPQWVGGEYQDPQQNGNAAAHQREGQNVLYNDSHVSFEKYANVGVNNDNIWMNWGTDPGTTIPDEDERQTGIIPPADVGDGIPSNEADAYLVCESNS
jgi:prepilin-type N-terminal cleavage/methylation domain-containing protein